MCRKQVLGRPPKIFCRTTHQKLNMNATATDTNVLEEMNGGSDSDTSPEDAREGYQPISAIDYDYDYESNSDGDQMNSEASSTRDLPNGYDVHEAEDGISSMQINNSEDEGDESAGEGEVSGLVMRRAFREDEIRRNAPLSQENAMRVIEAMRGVSFAGMAPDWANQLSEDRWMDGLRRIRQPPAPPPGSMSTS